MLSDHTQRQFATNPNHSVIVQAPAGSGKTYLLTWRLVNLLCLSTQPDQILVVTFGKKATQEIKNRLIEWLEIAEQYQTVDQLPANIIIPKQVFTLYHHQKISGWDLLENPHLLAIKTIDALCSQISDMDFAHSLRHRQLTIEQDAIYQNATERMLADVQQNTAAKEVTNAVLEGLRFFAGNRYQLINQLTHMLISRDAWAQTAVQVASATNDNSSYLDTHQKQQLQQLAQILTQYATNCLTEFDQLPQVVNLAHAYLSQQDNDDHLLSQWPTQSNLPAIDDINSWQSLADLLLTKSKVQLRKKLTAAEGFPPASDKTVDVASYAHAKKYLTSTLSTLASRADDNLLNCLNLLRLLPNHAPAQAQEHASLTLLAKLLYYSLAYLEMEFSATQKTDYVAIATHALQTLEQPEIAAKVDTQYSHLLVDEFQDTSLLQLQLFYKLTENWQDDKNSIFVVGDPMQSIYAFRKARVGIFQHVWQQGWPNLSLTPKSLVVNLRARTSLIDWVNTCMQQLVGNQSRQQNQHQTASLFDAIGYQQAASKPQAINTDPPVEIAIENTTETTLLNTLTRIHTQAPQATIAILVTKQKHASDVLPILRQAGLAFYTGKIGTAWQTELMQDLLTLLKWLYYPFDSFLQYSLLKSHWFALSTNQIAALKTTNWQLGQTVDWTIFDNPNEQTLTALQQKVTLFEKLWQNIAPKIRQTNWTDLLNQALYWLPHTTEQHSGFRLILQSFHHSLALATENGKINWDWLVCHLQAAKISHQQPSKSSTASFPPIAIMTIHAAKGLEFDYVILPFIDKKVKGKGSDMPPLLLQLDFLNLQHQPCFLAGAYDKINQAQHNSYYQIIYKLLTIKQDFELKRLFYVAITRAKKQVYFVGQLQANKSPTAGSIAAMLIAGGQELTSNATSHAPTITHLPHWQLTANDKLLAASNLRLNNPTTSHTNAQLINMSRLTQQNLGTALHLLLHHWINKQIDLQVPQLTTEKLTNYLLHYSGLVLVANLGVQLNNRINNLRQNLYQDGMAQWLLSLQLVMSEQAIYHQGKTLIPDVVALEKNTATGQDCLWIIDFKTSELEAAIGNFDTANNATKEQAFSAQLMQYCPQLIAYGEALAAQQAHLLAGIKDIDIKTDLTGLPIYLALYFPLTSRFFAWPLNHCIPAQQ